MLKPWSNGKAIQQSWTRKFATESLRLGWNKNWTGATEVQWVNTSWKELRWEERDERKVEERCQNLRQELRSSGQMMEVCPSSYRQNLFLDPIALHFLNLETSATRLARVLLVLFEVLHIFSYVFLYHVSFLCFSVDEEEHMRELQIQVVQIRKDPQNFFSNPVLPCCATQEFFF